MISSLIAILSLNLTATLIQNFGVVAATLPVTGATVTTPIQVTSPNHGVAPGRTVHGIVSGVTGTSEANGLWELTVVDPNTLSLATYTAQGIGVDSIGVNAYTGGGQIQYTFPDGRILLGRRNLALSTAAASPRIVFIPCEGRAWNFEGYGGAGPDLQPASVPNVRGSAQQQSMTLGPEIATEYSTFEVYVSASGPNYGNALAPDTADFDATQAVVQALFVAMYDACGQRAKVLHESWPSQLVTAGSQTQRGQQWMGVVEFQQPVTRTPKQFVPIGTYLIETVEPVNAGSGDATVITIHQNNGP